MLDESGIVAVAGPTDFPTSRVAIRSDPSLAPEHGRHVDDSSWACGKSACVYTRVGTDDDLTEQLLERGFVELSTTPEMVCDAADGSRERRPA